MKKCFICGKQNCICRQEISSNALNIGNTIYSSHNLNYKRKKIKIIKKDLIRILR